jgi:hypothetical protein
MDMPFGLIIKPGSANFQRSAYRTPSCIIENHPPTLMGAWIPFYLDITEAACIHRIYVLIYARTFLA